MGCSPLFCCFRGKNVICVSLTGLIMNIISFAFLIWGLVDVLFYKDSSEALYILAFIIICFCLTSFIVIFIVSTMKIRKRCSRTMRIFCISTLIFCLIAFIFLLIAWIISLKDYVDTEKDFPGKFWGNRQWASVILPPVITIICLLIMAKSVNYLYKFYTDNLFPIFPIKQNSTSSIPNISQSGIFQNNGQNYQVNIQQSEANLNNK